MPSTPTPGRTTGTMRPRITSGRISTAAHLAGRRPKSGSPFSSPFKGVPQQTGGTALRRWHPRNGGPAICRASPSDYDPLTGVQFPGIRSPEPHRESRASQRTCSRTRRSYPLPTCPGTSNITRQLHIEHRGRAHRGLVSLTSIDARLSDTNNVSGRYSFANFHTNGIRGALPVQLLREELQPSAERPALNWTRISSSTIINEARVGFDLAPSSSPTCSIWRGLEWQCQPLLGIVSTGRSSPPGVQLDRALATTAASRNRQHGRGRGQRHQHVPIRRHPDDQSGPPLHEDGRPWLRYQQNRFYPGNNGLFGLFDTGAPSPAPGLPTSCSIEAKS